MADILTCPVCGAPLRQAERRYVCANAHSFDISAKRYVNLLVGKDGVIHGDNKEMIDARHRFLQGGWYRPLLKRVGELCLSVFPTHGVLLDCGCGEGYYTDGICQTLKMAGKAPSCVGVDISKNAMMLAGKSASAKEGSLALAVASVYRLPIADDSCDMAVSLFAPLCDTEFLRVLKKGGHLLLAVPGKKHLWGLKELLYDTPYENELKDTDLGGFSLVSQCTVEDTVTLTDGNTVCDLFSMTPYGYRTPKAGRERLQACTSLTTPISFELLLYRKN